MAEHVELGPRSIPGFLSVVLRHFGRRGQVEEVAVAEPVVAPSELAIQAPPVEPTSVHPTAAQTISPRERRMLAYRVSPPRSDVRVPTKRKQMRENRSGARVVSPSPQQTEHREVVRPRSLMLTPRFAKEFEGLSPAGRAEIKGALRVIAEGKGQFHPLYGIKRSVKLHTGYEHTGGRDNLRVIFLPVDGVEGNYYALAVLRGHRYGPRTIDSFLESASYVPNWVDDNKMIALDTWMQSLT